MEHYLMLNGKQIDLTEEQVKDIKQSFGIGNVQLSSIKVAEPFKIGDYELFVLEQLDDTAVVMLKEPIRDEEQFGNNNNYDDSNADKLCNEFGQVIEKLVGADNLIEHTVDLTADDGLKCYGSLQRKMSLLTAQQYRDYVYVLDKHKLDKWWWLATAHSTAKHDNNSWIKCVSPSCRMGSNDCGSINGVRPFCILKSNIFVSK